MKRIFRTISMILIAGLISCPVVEAQTRNTGTQRVQTPQRTTTTQQVRPTSTQQVRPASSTNISTGNSMRPSNSGVGAATQQRPSTTTTQQRPSTNTNIGNQMPGNNNTNNGLRPGTNVNNTQNPSTQQPVVNHGNNNNKPNTQQPVVNPGNNNNQRPDNVNVNPGNNNVNGIRPGTNVGTQRPVNTPAVQRPVNNRPTNWTNLHFGTPYRPLMPANFVWTAPRRPAGFIPVGGPVVSTILGVALGTAINVTVNSLINHGYNVTGYGDNTVYVQDAMQMGLLWPNATLYYNNGGLYASEFVYSTPYADMQRYNTVYNTLLSAYGNPYSSTNTGGMLTTTWWGANGQFVQLQYTSASSVQGGLRYYTILSFGN